jgi:hypothetical protein
MAVASRIGMKRNYITPVMHIIKLYLCPVRGIVVVGPHAPNVRSGSLLLGIFILFLT